MQYVSIDIETTGLNPDCCDIIEFAAVIDDLQNPEPIEKLPTFQTFFVQPTYTGQPHALSMHQKTFAKISQAIRQNNFECRETDERFMSLQDLPIAFYNFLTKDKYPAKKIMINVAGKNAASFDLPFLTKKITNWGDISFSQRVIDPAILYYQLGDERLPNSKECMIRAGLQGEVAHTALEDALMVVKLIRHKLLLSI